MHARGKHPGRFRPGIIRGAPAGHGDSAARPAAARADVPGGCLWREVSGSARHVAAHERTASRLCRDRGGTGAQDPPPTASRLGRCVEGHKVLGSGQSRRLLRILARHIRGATVLQRKESAATISPGHSPRSPRARCRCPPCNGSRTSPAREACPHVAPCGGAMLIADWSSTRVLDAGAGR